MIRDVIQVAGIMDLEEAGMLLRLGVDWLGFPFELPVHGEDLTKKEAAEIIASLNCGPRAVLITYLRRAQEIVKLSAELGAQRVQIHGDIALNEINKLRNQAPELFLIKSLVVRKDNIKDLEANVQNFAPWVDAFLTDTYDEETHAEGATGQVHDWNVSRSLVMLSPKPVLLAGGLNAQNVLSAIRAVLPAGVDAHTGLEDSHGRKDQRKVFDFVNEARTGFNLA